MAVIASSRILVSMEVAVNTIVKQWAVWPFARVTMDLSWNRMPSRVRILTSVSQPRARSVPGRASTLRDLSTVHAHRVTSSVMMASNVIVL